MSAELQTIKSEQENVFIIGLITRSARSFVSLGMRRENGQLIWFDGESAERSNTERYNAWGDAEPSNHTGENSLKISWSIQKWNDNTCHYKKYGAPFVLCKKPRV